MNQTSTTNTRAERPAESHGEVPQGVDLWLTPIYVPDGDVRALLSPAACLRSGTRYVVTGSAVPVRIDADEAGRLSLADHTGVRRPIVWAAADRMATRADLETGDVTAEAVMTAIDGVLNVDDVDAPTETDNEVACRSCEFTVVAGPACVVCGDANPDGPALVDEAAPVLFNAPRLPELV